MTKLLLNSTNESENETSNFDKISGKDLQYLKVLNILFLIDNNRYSFFYLICRTNDMSKYEIISCDKVRVIWEITPLKL